MPADQIRVYADACVFIAFVGNEESRADIVQAVLDDARNRRIELLTSVLSIAEVAFAANDSTGVVSPEDERAIDQLWVPASPITLVDISETVTRTARSLIRQARVDGGGGVRSADALHLASAQLHGCSRFFTFEKASTRARWNQLVDATVEEPFTDFPQLDL